VENHLEWHHCAQLLQSIYIVKEKLCIVVTVCADRQQSLLLQRIGYI